MGRSVPHSPTLYFSLPRSFDVSVPRSPCHDWSVPLLPLSSPYMKSLKLDDQFFIKIYIFVQKRHTYVIMAKSEVTGCVCFCQGASSAANHHLRFPGIEPPPQLAVAAGPRPCLLVTLCRARTPPQARSALCQAEEGTRVPSVAVVHGPSRRLTRQSCFLSDPCSHHSSQKQSEEKNIYFYLFWCLFKKLKGKNTLKP